MTNAHLYREIEVCEVVPFPGITMHFLREVPTGRNVVLVKGGTRTDRDNARLMTNHLLRESGRPAFPFLDEDEIDAQAQFSPGFSEVLERALRKESTDG